VPRRIPLPDDLGPSFTIRDARAADIKPGRLRSADLTRPFSGVRARPTSTGLLTDEDPYAAQRRVRVERALLYAPRLRPGQYFSHDTAAAIYGAPLPLERTSDGEIARGDDLALHVSTLGDGPLVRTAGVVHHRGDPRLVAVTAHAGLAVPTAPSTWAQSGAHSVSALIALGDYFCRAWRAGVGRRDVGRAPFATVSELSAAMSAGRRIGAARLREAISWIREDAWSPRESELRYLLVSSGLPEPALNVDLFDEDGGFLGCWDMVFFAQRVAVEYHGRQHADSWGADVERAARLRAAGWIIIDVTAESLRSPEVLLRRIRLALSR
jgi:hypothetical protein